EASHFAYTGRLDGVVNGDPSPPRGDAEGKWGGGSEQLSEML
ncbi:MAG: hypothetical protein PVTTEEND_001392, partial [Candidatus Fervidibacter sp.]